MKQDVKSRAYNKASLNLAKSICQGVILGTTHLKEKQTCENQILRLVNPTKLIGVDGIEVVNTLNFEDACIAIRYHNLHTYPENISIIQYINCIEKLKKLIKRNG